MLAFEGLGVHVDDYDGSFELKHVANGWVIDAKSFLPRENSPSQWIRGWKSIAAVLNNVGREIEAHEPPLGQLSTDLALKVFASFEILQPKGGAESQTVNPARQR
jgi:hypothetical protein